MKNCSNCALKEVEFSDLSTTIDDSFIHVNNKMYGLCKSGNNEKLKTFYLENDREAVLDCFEQTEAEKRLDRLINLADNLLKTAKE